MDTSVATDHQFDPQITYQTLVTSLYQTVLGMLATPERFATARNTELSAIKALAVMSPSDLAMADKTTSSASSAGRKLLQKAQPNAGCGHYAHGSMPGSARRPVQHLR